MSFLLPFLTITLVIVFIVMQARKRAAAAAAPTLKRRGPAVVQRASLPEELACGLRRIACGMHFRRVEVQDHTFGYLEGGRDDAETVVLLHGYAGEKDDWLPVAKKLRRKYRVIVPDLPGSGDSPRVGHGRYDVVTQARRLRVFFRKIDVDHCHLVGCYTGGAVAAIYASVFPDEARTLTLVESFGIEPINPAEIDRLAARGNPFADAGRAERLMLGRSRRSASAQKRVARRGVAEAVWRDVTTERPYLLQSVLSEIKVPTLLLWGDSNKVVHLAAQRVLETGIPGSRAVVVKGAAHLMMIDQPVELLRHLEPFLANARTAAESAPPQRAARRAGAADSATP